jgi:hypothetical protein
LGSCENFLSSYFACLSCYCSIALVLGVSGTTGLGSTIATFSSSLLSGVSSLQADAAQVGSSLSAAMGQGTGFSFVLIVALLNVPRGIGTMIHMYPQATLLPLLQSGRW